MPLRESFRQGGKVKNPTLAHLSRWPDEKVEALSAVPGGEAPRTSLGEVRGCSGCDSDDLCDAMARLGVRQVEIESAVRGRLQIVCGLLASAGGTPIAIEVFAGDAGDPTTVVSPYESLAGVERAFRLRHRPRGVHPRHDADTDPATGSRSPRRLPPPRLRVVRTSGSINPMPRSPQ